MKCETLLGGERVLLMIKLSDMINWQSKKTGYYTTIQIFRNSVVAPHQDKIPRCIFFIIEKNVRLSDTNKLWHELFCFSHNATNYSVNHNCIKHKTKNKAFLT